MRRLLVGLPLLLLPAAALRAQMNGVPEVRHLTCPAANALLGKPQHEEEAVLSGGYLTTGDSTYLIAYRSTKTVRRFVPFMTAEYAGPGPFDPEEFTLGLGITNDASQMVAANGPIAATLILDDFTTFELGNVTLSPLIESEGTLARIQVMVQLPKPALLKLVHAKSALLKWGQWHADLEPRDIGMFRAYDRALTCASASMPQVSLFERAFGPPAIPSPDSLPQENEDRRFNQIGRTLSTRVTWRTVNERTSCATADSLLGPPRGEGSGTLSVGTSPRGDSTFLSLYAVTQGGGLRYSYNTQLRLAGHGPFAPRGLDLGFTVASNLSRAEPWSDTMHATLILDDSTHYPLLPMRLSQASDKCCTPPLDVTFVLQRAPLLALLMANRAELAWADQAIWADRQGIGLIRAFERLLICAPHSLSTNYLTD